MAIANKKQITMQDEFRVAAKTRLLELRLSVTALAEELGFQRNTVSIAINHPTMLPTVKRRIARRLRLS